MNMHEIGLRISDLRKQRDMTQLELADKMGVSYQAVSSWERGSTMPDISRLPEISQILAVSIDELLGNGPQAQLVKTVLTQQTPETPPHIGHITEVAPLLKPSQMDSLVESTTGFDLNDLLGLAPFISTEVLSQLAVKAEEKGDTKALHKLAPFLDKETLERLAHKIEAASGIDGITRLLPFLHKETLTKFAAKAADTGNLQELRKLAPFLDTNFLDELVLKTAKAQ